MIIPVVALPPPTSRFCLICSTTIPRMAGKSPPKLNIKFSNIQFLYHCKKYCADNDLKIKLTKVLLKIIALVDQYFIMDIGHKIL